MVSVMLYPYIFGGGCYFVVDCYGDVERGWRWRCSIG